MIMKMSLIAAMHGARILAPNALFSFAFAISLGVSAASPTTITIDDVTQRWPWNNKIDISYTVTGGQDLSTSNFCKIVFTTMIAGIPYRIDGVTDVGASANPGTHRVTWTLPSGVYSKECTMSAAVYASDTPSGDDYMVVDLVNGGTWFEGMLATQEASNDRYNTDLYKSADGAGNSYMVLRKVPAGGSYFVGDNASHASIYHPKKTWTTDRDYYIGVFPVTQHQYTLIYGSNPSKNKTGSNVSQRPVEGTSWNKIRYGNYSWNAAIASPTSAVARITEYNANASFLSKLTFVAGNRFTFDLPTLLMAEIAQRAGATTTYSWGTGTATDYVVSSENSGGTTVAVGSRLPNNWGIYDTAGNVNEWVRDGTEYTNLNGVPDPFTPGNDLTATAGSNAMRIRRGGGNFSNASTADGFKASGFATQKMGSEENWLGFRVSVTMD